MLKASFVGFITLHSILKSLKVNTDLNLVHWYKKVQILSLPFRAYKWFFKAKQQAMYIHVSKCKNDKVKRKLQ
jgi:hypothetical protein